MYEKKPATFVPSFGIEWVEFCGGPQRWWNRQADEDLRARMAQRRVAPRVHAGLQRMLEHQRLMEENERNERAEERRRIQKRRDQEAKIQREREEREAKLENERRLAQEKEKAERAAVQNVLTVCKGDGLHPQFIARLRPLLENGPKTVRANDVLQHVWIPLGKPKQGGPMEVWQEWAMEQLDVSSGWSGASSQLKKLKSKTVNPMKRDLGVLVDTAQSPARYGTLVRLWEKYEGSPKYNEVIERVYIGGEREDFVLFDLDIFQGLVMIRVAVL